MSLFLIEQEYQFILQELENLEGELTPELAEELAINEEQFESKVKSYRAMIMKWKADLAAAKEEEARIKAFKQNRQNAIDRLTTNLDYAMQHRDMSVFDMGVDGKISYRKSTSVVVDENSLDDAWFNEKVTKTPDKTALKKALQAGEKIEGASLLTKNNIQIK